MRGGARSFLSRISVRVLAFNVLVVFLPIAGVLSLDTYERQLLDSLERSLVQQGRALAAGLEDFGAAAAPVGGGHLRRLRQRHEARIRVVDARGVLLADSASLARRGTRGARGGGQPGGVTAGAGDLPLPAGIVPRPRVAPVPAPPAAAARTRTSSTPAPVSLRAPRSPTRWREDTARRPASAPGSSR